MFSFKHSLEESSDFPTKICKQAKKSNYIKLRRHALMNSFGRMGNKRLKKSKELKNRIKPYLCY